jgi:5-(carboxyamino)imidazole ribonucleotide mutase
MHAESDVESNTQALVGVIMGSRNDYAVMRAAVDMLREFGVPHEVRVVSAHRTPELMFEYAATAASRGLRILIAGAGGAAHLPGMVAASTVLPVLGVPIAATALQGFDALLSIVQMPKGVPVGTLAIGAAGAANAGLLAVQILATTDAELQAKLVAWRAARRDEVLAQTIDSDPDKEVSA